MQPPPRGDGHAPACFASSKMACSTALLPLKTPSRRNASACQSRRSGSQTASGTPRSSVPVCPTRSGAAKFCHLPRCCWTDQSWRWRNIGTAFQTHACHPSASPAALPSRQTTRHHRHQTCFRRGVPSFFGDTAVTATRTREKLFLTDHVDHVPAVVGTGTVQAKEHVVPCTNGGPHKKE